MVSNQTSKERGVTSGGVASGGVVSAEPEVELEDMDTNEEGEEIKDNSDSSSDDSGSDSNAGMGRRNLPLPAYPPFGPPGRQGHGGHMINPFYHAAGGRFGGTGHRLGGKEGQVIAGDSSRRSKKALLAGTHIQ